VVGQGFQDLERLFDSERWIEVNQARGMPQRRVERAGRLGS
jgi:hypothetical protein